VPGRKKKFSAASSAQPDIAPPMNVLAGRLHPERQYLVIDEVTQEVPGVRTFKLVPDRQKGTDALAYFRAGQYLSIKIEVNGVAVTRPYSISSSPNEAKKGYYTITTKAQEKGFVTDFIFDNWAKGTKVTASGPEGQFYYERLRDLKHIVGIAGGSGITPFISMARQFYKECFPVNFTLFYGCNRKDEIIFYDALCELSKNSGGKFKVVHVLCGEKPFEGAEEGFVTADIIGKYVDPEKCSFFICGPQPMYEFVKKEIGSFSLPVKQVRREVFGEIKNIRGQEGYPKETKESFELTVTINGKTTKMPALANESLLVAIERAGLNPPSKCRSGVCSFCRCALVKGDVFIPEETDGRRGADKKFSFIHACASYPLSDIALIVPGSEE
ncbi:MAG: iron-sulfur cluster-binding domain-containing protein, partial [Eubacteriales bacterium]|nr:iron-sulfur cluster-binding domain-containing protein [Eubacteriales bacterium]